MPQTLRTPGGSYMRRLDVESILKFIYTMDCVQIIGFSNVGKSALLRLLAQPDVWTQELGEAGREFLVVYMDCNRMLELNDQGFYELVLRCLQESSPALAALPELTEAYDILVAPASDFQIPLSFNRGLTAALQASTSNLILLLDEFDEPFAQIDSRVFLNLRALRDRYNAKLAYVTATSRPLRAKMPNQHSAEFCELFSQHTWYLAPLTRSDVERMAHRYMEAYEVNFTAADFDFIYHWTGGHPPMVDGVCRILHSALDEIERTPEDAVERWELHRSVVRRLRVDENLAQECEKIWKGCTEAEQAELRRLFDADYQPDPAVMGDLVQRHIAVQVEGRYQLFCRLLAEYLQRQAIPSAEDANSLWVDIESGDVLVDGFAVETLTNLEYRLMLLFFNNVEKIVDKYQIVTYVWGESYIDEVDDTRIEKLISRLRQKIEPDPGAPRFLTTVRGRGYRLNLNHEMASGS